ncbi:MAG: hypothetical protein LC634_01355 [Sphingomonadales bacterium]|nr:hypothetical protein [Sphingomonadales bacterium]
MVLHVGDGRHAIDFDDSRVADVADRWEWRPPGGIGFAFPEDVDRLMWARQAFKFGELFPGGHWPPFLVFDLDRPRGEFARKCAVVIRLIDEERQEIFSSHIKLAAPRPLIVPLSSEVRGLVTHIRLHGEGVLPPLALSLSVPNRTAVEQYRTGPSDKGGVGGGARTGLAGAVERAGELRFSWDGLLRETISTDDPRYLTGVLDADRAAGLEGFVSLRLDQGVSAHSYLHCRGYVFDDSATDGLFGWRGVMTPHNNLANAALARHLADSRRNGLPTTLLYDEASLRKPFFEDFRETFDDCLPAREAAHLFATEMVGS